MKLTIVRHGITEWNKQHRWQGQTDTELSLEGREQARKLANRLKTYPISVIYTSPLKRALETAKEIKKYHKDADFIIDEQLQEINFGKFEGLTTDEIMQRYKKFYEAREKDKFNFKLGGESLADCQARAFDVLERVLKSRRNSVIVAHGTLNKLFLMKLMGVSYEEIGKHHLNNAAVFSFEIKNSKVKTLEFNSDEHLRN